MDKNISNANGEATIETSPDEHTVKYHVIGQIKKSFRNKFTRKNNNNINKPRSLAFASVSLPDSIHTVDIVSKIEADPINKEIIKDKSLAYLNILTNKWEKNLKNSANKGTVVSNSTKKNSFNENVNLGKVHTEKKLYFLRPGIGTKLLIHIIDDMRTKGIQCLILDPANKLLEKYYENFGFKPFPQKVVMFKTEDSTFYFGSDKSGELMYLLL